MFIRHKKGELIVPLIIKLLVAVILIFVVLGFGSKIWGALFPNGDKSSLKSLELAYNLIKTQAASSADYKSVSVTLYLKDSYRIIFFDTDEWDCKKEENWFTGPTQAVFFAPKACEYGKQCICLYDTTPSGGYEKRDKDVVKCYNFDNKINIDHERFDLNQVACDPEGKKLYTPYLFIKMFNQEKSQSDIYVVEDNDTNKELAKEWSRIVCRSSMDTSGFCTDIKDGTARNPTNDDAISKMYDYCQNVDPKNTLKVTTVLCKYDEKTKKCNAECSYGDVTKSCGTIYKKCEDFNENLGVINYIDTSTNYKDEYMCKNPDKYCGDIGPCTFDSAGVYTCKDIASGNGAIDSKSEACAAPPGLDSISAEKDECKITESYSLGALGSFIESYNDSNTKCKEYMEKNFYAPVPMMVCRPDTADNPDNSKACEDYLSKGKNFEYCEFKYIKKGNFILLLHYNKDKYREFCGDIDKYFMEVQFCSTATTQEATQ